MPASTLPTTMPLESRGLNAFGTSGASSSVGVTIFFLIISILAVVGRFASRKLRAATYGIDDWLMVAGLVGECLTAAFQ